MSSKRVLLLRCKGKKRDQRRNDRPRYASLRGGCQKGRGLDLLYLGNNLWGKKSRGGGGGAVRFARDNRTFKCSKSSFIALFLESWHIRVCALNSILPLTLQASILLYLT